MHAINETKASDFDFALDQIWKVFPSASLWPSLPARPVLLSSTAAATGSAGLIAGVSLTFGRPLVNRGESR